MTPTAVAEPEVKVATRTTSTPPVALQPERGPVPIYLPTGPDPINLPTSDPKWQRLASHRAEAWRRGISNEELNSYQIGFCPDQIGYQINKLQDWLAKS